MSVFFFLQHTLNRLFTVVFSYIDIGLVLLKNDGRFHPFFPFRKKVTLKKK